jgi:hypothetical protein
MTRGGTRGWLGGRAGQNRFHDKNGAVSTRGMRWLGVLLRLTPKPSVRFIADVPPCDGGAHAIPRMRTEKFQMSYHNASLSYSIRRAVLAHVAPRYQRATDAQKTLLLDQIIEVTGYERKYAIRLLNHDPKGPLALCVHVSRSTVRRCKKPSSWLGALIRLFF